MRAVYSFTIRWHAPPNLQGVIKCKPVRISDSIWQHITASNKLHAFTSIVDQLIFWVYMPRDRSFLTFRRNVLFLLGQNLLQADAELAGKERMCPIALARVSKSLPLAPTHSICLLPQLWPVRGSPNYPTGRHIRSFSTSTVFTWIKFTHLEDWANTFFQNT
jgi:hypothetical protein